MSAFAGATATSGYTRKRISKKTTRSFAPNVTSPLSAVEGDMSGSHVHTLQSVTIGHEGLTC